MEPEKDGFQVRFISKLPGGPHFQVNHVSFRGSIWITLFCYQIAILLHLRNWTLAVPGEELAARLQAAAPESWGFPDFNPHVLPRFLDPNSGNPMVNKPLNKAEICGVCGGVCGLIRHNIWGDDSRFDEWILQMGWENHQLRSLWPTLTKFGVILTTPHVELLLIVIFFVPKMRGKISALQNWQNWSRYWAACICSKLSNPNAPCPCMSSLW